MSVSLNKKHQLLRQQQTVVINSIHMIIHLIEVSQVVRAEVNIEEEETDLIEEEELVKLWLFKYQILKRDKTLMTMRVALSLVQL